VDGVISPGVTVCWPIANRAGEVTSETLTAPVPAGHPVAGGGAGAVTTAVGTDVELVEPALFVAVTATRNVVPTSACVSTYVCAVAPPIAAQLAPVASQRLHAYV